jgi:hypothetical protein
MSHVTPALIALMILGAVALALIGAALYAFFGHPTSHAGKKRKQQVASGFRLAGGILLGIFLVACVVNGADLTMSGRSSRISRSMAALIAVTAFGIIAVMVQRWAKYFAGWVIWGVYNSIVVAMSGHAMNNPSISVSRPYALAAGVVYLFSVLPTIRFAKKYRLNVADKIALMVWILAFTGAELFPKVSLEVLSIGSAALVIAWWLTRSDHRSRGHMPNISVTSAIRPEADC